MKWFFLASHHEETHEVSDEVISFREKELTAENEEDFTENIEQTLSTICRDSRYCLIPPD